MHKLLVIGLLLLNANVWAQETNGHAIERARNFGREWNTLIPLQDTLTGEAKLNLKNYMLGFAEGAVMLMEELQNPRANVDFSKSIDFYFEQTQILKRGLYIKPYRDGFRGTGFCRTYWGDTRYGEYEFIKGIDE